MKSLRDKLAALGHVTSQDTESGKERADQQSTPGVPAPDPSSRSRPAEAPDLERLLDATETICPSGTVLVRTTRFPVGRSWGDSALDRPRFGPVLQGYADAELAGVRDPGRTVYVDTETTGLAGGSGTYAFLVGIGRFSDDAFVLRQLFLRGPWEERALLELASLLLEGAEAVVSYNGKSFDVPLLRSRWAYHGLPDPLGRTPHVDLLHISRRVWRERLSSCTLGDVERGALGMGRSASDVPGHLIPELYFSFLRSGDAAPLLDVMEHNELDICSLAALLVRVDDLLEGRLDPRSLPVQDVVSLARTRESFGHAEQALALLHAAVERHDEFGRDAAELLAEAYLRAGRLAKRLEFWDEADLHFSRAAVAPAALPARLEAMVELAKLYEHQHRDPGGALAWVDRAVELLEGVAGRREREAWAESLDYRRARVQRKLTRKESATSTAGPASS